MDAILKSLLEQISDLHDIPVGAYNIRNNGQSESRNSTDTIQIVSKTDGKSGIDIRRRRCPGADNQQGI